MFLTQCHFTYPLLEVHSPVGEASTVRQMIVSHLCAGLRVQIRLKACENATSDLESQVCRVLRCASILTNGHAFLRFLLVDVYDVKIRCKSKWKFRQNRTASGRWALRLPSNTKDTILLWHSRQCKATLSTIRCHSFTSRGYCITG